MRGQPRSQDPGAAADVEDPAGSAGAKDADRRTGLGVATDDVPGQLPRILAGTLIQIPAAWMLGAVTMLAFGLLPRIATAVAWAGFLFIQVFELLGPIMGIDFRYIEVLIPFWHLPRILAGGTFTALPLITLTVLGAALVLAGMAALHRRDLVQPG